jgi:hypothetical protein
MRWQAHDRGWRKVTVVSFYEEGTMQVAPVDRTGDQKISGCRIHIRLPG